MLLQSNQSTKRFLPIPESVSKHLEPEPKLSDFTVIKELGSGSFGHVILAQHNKVIAVDVVPAKVELINNKKSPIIDKELEEYLRRRQEEQRKAQYIVKDWFNKKFDEICRELHFIQSAIPYLKGDALAIAYHEESKLEYLSEVFMDANDEEKIELYKEWREKEDGHKRT